MHWRNETIVNPDECEAIGIYQWATPTTITTNPIAYGTLIVSNAFGYKCQIAIGVDASVYVRHKTYDQEWSAWRNIANGGNADTVDGYHVDNLIHASGSIPPTYFTEFLRINDDTKSIERWSTDNLRVEFANNAAKAKNADTVGSRYSHDFLGKDYVYPAFLNYGFGTDLNNYVTEYHGFIYNCENSPIANDYGFLDVSFFDGTGFLPSTPDKGGVVLQKFSRRDNSVFTRMRYANVWSDWKKISTTPIKSTGWLTSPTNSEGDIIFNLPTDTGRTYIAACSISSIAILFSDGTNYRARIFDGNMKAVISTSVTYRLWYIEE